MALSLVAEGVVALLLLSRCVLLCALTVCSILGIVLVLGLVEVGGVLRKALAKYGLLGLRLVLLGCGSKTRCLLGCRDSFRCGRLLCGGLPGCGRK